MRKLLWPFVVAAMLLGSAGPAAAAPVPKRDCASRGEGPRPIERLARPGDLRIGPVAFVGLARAASKEGFERLAPRSDGRHLMKTPLMVRAGRVVTVSVARADRGVAGLTFVQDASLDAGVPAVKFVACERDERAFSYDGVVGPVTAFAGGWSLAEPACVRLTVRVRGRRLPYARTVSFGMGRAASACDRA